MAYVEEVQKENIEKGAWLSVLGIERASYLRQFEQLHANYSRPVVLTEIGYCSGACDRSHNASVVETQHQANHYEALLVASAGRDWILGAFWWKCVWRGSNH